METGDVKIDVMNNFPLFNLKNAIFGKHVEVDEKGQSSECHEILESNEEGEGKPKEYYCQPPEVSNPYLNYQNQQQNLCSEKSG